ncbi:wax ester synthase-like Acyl-CoA acyltransferase domain protein [Mycobacterium ulcerans str. Harvey]|uniref:Wax ester synthase-like Acyl-CoA acyltransferase domain protein n=1 Tax=Mycobacterium ulcerans str. Harvey TaxID=1299332 RepID=A0ABN0R377_MYCUL|nr:wax ester synthase-like Acyl-CoA acyltransferase domain protein [Mycobacterium ulcerans str. Harvey]
MHVVDGLADGRFAIYSKFHHALLDGASALMLLQRALSDDPRDTEVRAPWNLPRSRITRLALPGWDRWPTRRDL